MSALGARLHLGGLNAHAYMYIFVLAGHAGYVINFYEVALHSICEAIGL